MAKNLFQPEVLAAVEQRITALNPANQRQWGKMTLAQMVAHCTVGLQTATGECRPKRVWIGYLIGRLIKGKALGNETPLRRNTPTAREFLIAGDPELEAEKQRLLEIVRRFALGGPQAASSHPHAFFGRLTGQEWAELMYKHLDHHLRQFGG